MASVNRYFADVAVGKTEECVLASDYDKMVNACRHLLRCKKPKCDKCTKALAMIGEGGEEGK